MTLLAESGRINYHGQHMATVFFEHDAANPVTPPYHTLDECGYTSNDGTVCGKHSPWKSGIGYDWCMARADDAVDGWQNCGLCRWKRVGDKIKEVPKEQRRLNPAYPPVKW